MRKTITTLSRFIISTTSWWVRGPIPIRIGTSFAAILFLLSCDDDTAAIGFKDPNRNIQVFAKEFIIPATTFLMDSVVTSNSVAIPGSRLMVGYKDDPHFGKTTATAIAQYWLQSPGTKFSPNAVLEKAELKLVYDYYWDGSTADRNVTYSVYELGDSILSYIPHYAKEVTPIGNLLGQTTRTVSPTVFEESIDDNEDDDTQNDLIDSLVVDLGNTFGSRLLAVAMDTLGSNEEKFLMFSKFRRQFPGIAVKASNAVNVVGFDHTHAKSRITLHYKIDTTRYQLHFVFTSVSNLRDYQSFTELTTDRSGTPVAGLGPFWQDYNAPDGMAYTQGGTGVMTKLDFSEVYDYFKSIPIKVLSVAELKINGEDQFFSPKAFSLRALRSDNRHIKAQTSATDAAGDSYNALDGAFLSIHLVYPGGYETSRDVFTGPLAEAVGDDNKLFLLTKQETDGVASYQGFLTNYLQQELSLTESQFLRYYALVPQTPDLGKCVSGFYFPKDAVRLKIYYTTPKLAE